MVKDGDKQALEYLIDKYKELVNMKVTRYFIIGAEKDDIVQEGLIGLYKAIKAYDSEKENTFKSFANLCVERQIITAIKSSNRQKHIPLNQSLSLSGSTYEDNNELSLLDVLNDKFVEDPLDTLTNKERLDTLRKKIDDNLSDFEKQVIELHVQGLSYVDIAQKLDSTTKSVDNAIQRIRKKAIKCIDQDDKN